MSDPTTRTLRILLKLARRALTLATDHEQLAAIRLEIGTYLRQLRERGETETDGGMTMDLKAEALKMMRENPEYLEDARKGANVDNTVIGSVLSLVYSRPRQYTEQAVRAALAELDG